MMLGLLQRLRCDFPPLYSFLDSMQASLYVLTVLEKETS